MKTKRVTHEFIITGYKELERYNKVFRTVKKVSTLLNLLKKIAYDDEVRTIIIRKIKP